MMIIIIMSHRLILSIETNIIISYREELYDEFKQDYVNYALFTPCWIPLAITRHNPVMFSNQSHDHWCSLRGGQRIARLVVPRLLESLV